MRLFAIWKTCKARACLFALAATAGWCQAAPAPDIPSKVFFTTDNASLRAGRQVSGSVVQRMVDRLVVRATGKPTVADAWRSLVNKKDRVGIKVAASGGPVSGTNPEVVDAIVVGRWVDPVKGYDIKSQVTAPLLGKLIWGDSGFGNKSGTRVVDFLGTGDQLSSRSYYSNVLSKEVTKIINVPSLADSFLTGVNGALANMVLPNLDNWRRFTRAPFYGDPYLAEIYADAMIHDKVVLTIMDGLVQEPVEAPSPRADDPVARKRSRRRPRQRQGRQDRNDPCQRRRSALKAGETFLL